jgi:hypothetical protein
VTILQEIHAWSKGLPAWQQGAIALIYASRELSAEAVGNLYTLAKSEAGCAGIGRPGDPGSWLATHTTVAVAPPSMVRMAPVM